MIPPYSLEKLYLTTSMSMVKPDFTVYTQERKLDSKPSTQDKIVGLILLSAFIFIISWAGLTAQKKMLGVYDLEDRVRYLEQKLYEK
jgi:hypothetical protein